MFICFGTFAIAWSLDALIRWAPPCAWGPGYFPTMLGGLLAVLGVAES